MTTELALRPTVPVAAPELLILDLQDAFQAFETTTSNMVELEYALDELMQEILLYLQDRYRAVNGLTALVNQIRTMQVHMNQIADGAVLAVAVGRLGRIVFDQLCFHGAYDNKGILMYEMGQWLTPSCPTFTRYQPCAQKSHFAPHLTTFTMSKIHHVRGVFNNNEFVDNGVAADKLHDYIQFNLVMRPGRAIFVDGICMYEGYLSKEQCDLMSQCLLEHPMPMDYDTTPYV